MALSDFHKLKRLLFRFFYHLLSRTMRAAGRSRERPPRDTEEAPPLQKRNRIFVLVMFLNVFSKTSRCL